MARAAPLRVLFLIRQLETGGAERQLATLLKSLDRSLFEAAIVCMYDGDPRVMAEVRGIQGIRMFNLGKTGRWDFGAILRLVSIVRRFKPDILHGYMSGANEIAQVLGWCFRVPAVWGVRVSDQQFEGYSRFRKAVFTAGNRIARHADLVIANSVAGRDAHVAHGYPADRVIVIHNGVDTARFSPDPEAGRRWRAANSIPMTDFLVCLPARLDPMKDHELFLAATARLPATAAGRSVSLACVGRGDADIKKRLGQRAAELGVADRLRWLPPTGDATGLYNGSDLVCSTSRFGEGFPNVLGEAMACGRVCVTTCCGDAAVVVGDAGFTAPVGDVDRFAAQLLRAAQLGPQESAEMGRAARDRIVREFGVEVLVRKTTATLLTLHDSWKSGIKRGEAIAVAAREAGRHD